MVLEKEYKCSCGNCFDEQIEQLYSMFDALSLKFVCPICNKVYEFEYEETWDGEEEHYYFIWKGAE